ncbi:hypothetical protein GN244_ATG20564 [Phytophthora infestans]|uniref:Uncharacterized protein n=1 Tax=Phytophthora infestans TaxID=4787 RepID=A0A833RMI7_PHYIN|nr:hypothetical protein GN244_ATG20564 [Phytophthora infestans]
MGKRQSAAQASGKLQCLGDSSNSVQSVKSVQPLGEGNNFHRSSSSQGFEQGRPAKYSDRTPGSGSGADSRHSNASSRTSSISGDKKPVSRTGSGSKPAAPEAQGNLEDFLSGSQKVPSAGAAPSSSPPKKDVNLMSDSGWNDAPATPAQPANATSDFLNAMDPLATRSAPSQPSPSKTVLRDPPKFDDDNGQTVGPVTMAEMEAHSKSTSDGSNVQPELGGQVDQE